MTDSSADRDPLDRLAEEFVARLRRGERPAVDDYAARLPGREAEVRELFPALVELEGAKPASGDRTGAFEPAADPGDPARVGEFRILRRVGRGGMGVVFEAVQESLGRHVALKLLPAEAVADPKRLERFRREARAAARLHHTNIVPVFGVGEADGRHYYAMQFIPGHPLDAVVAEVRRLKAGSGAPAAAPRAASEVAGALVTGTFPRSAPGPDGPAPETPAPAGSSAAAAGTASGGGSGYWATVARIGAQVADALAYAHGQGVLHRDVKPANLLLDPTGTVWVTDFGLAKSADADDLTHAGDVVGTLRYLAPERFDGAGDARADVYALGLTLYELLTLRPAFTAENRAKLVQEVTDANPPRPRAVEPRIPRDLETIVLKATARDPAGRYQTAALLADDLRRFLDGRTIAARRAGPAERAWRWAKRAPAVATLLALTLALLVAGTAVSVFFAVKADGERATAQARESDANAARKDADDRAADLRAEQEATAHLLYVSEMNRAGAAANEYRTARLLELLEATRPRPGAPDRRGWEWHYLRGLVRPLSEVRLDAAAVPDFMTGRTYDGRAAGFVGVHSLTANAHLSADGTRVLVPPIASRASGQRGGFVGFPSGETPGPEGFGFTPAAGAMFDTATGRALHTLPAPPRLVHSGPSALSRSGGAWASADGRYLASAGPVVAWVPGTAPNPLAPHRVRVTDVTTGREVGAGFEVPQLPATVAVHPNLDRVVAALAPTPDAPDARVVVWKPGDAAATRALPHPAGKEKTKDARVFVSPAGDTAVVAYDGGRHTILGPKWTTFAVHDLAAPAPPRVVESADQFSDPQFSPAGSMLAVTEGADQRVVRVYDVRAGKWAGRWTIPSAVPMPGDDYNQSSVTLAVTDDGRRVVLDAGRGVLVVGEPHAASSPREELWRTAVVRQTHGREAAASPLFPSAQFVVRLAPGGNAADVLATDGTLRRYHLGAFPGYAATWPNGLDLDGVSCRPMTASRAGRVVYAPLGGAEEKTGPQPLAVYDAATRRVIHRTTIDALGINEVSATESGHRGLVSTFHPPPAGNPDAAGETRHLLLALDRPGAPPLRTFISPAGPGSFGWGPTLAGGGRWVLEAEHAPRPADAHPLALTHPVRYRLWSAETGDAAGRFPADGAGWAGLHVSFPWFSPDGRVALVSTYVPPPAGTDPPVPVTVRAYDPASGRALWEYVLADRLPVEVSRVNPDPVVIPPEVAFSADGRRVVVVTAVGGVVRAAWFDAADGTPGGELRATGGATAYRSPVAVVGPAGRLAVCLGREVLLWDGRSPEPLRLAGHDSGAGAAAFTADGRRLFTYEANVPMPRYPVRGWDTRTGQELVALPGPLGDGWAQSREPLWLDGDRLMLMTSTGLMCYDGTPVPP